VADTLKKRPGQKTEPGGWEILKTQRLGLRATLVVVMVGIVVFISMTVVVVTVVAVVNRMMTGMADTRGLRSDDTGTEADEHAEQQQPCEDDSHLRADIPCNPASAQEDFPAPVEAAACRRTRFRVLWRSG
jgi:hypothetical protein